LSQSFHLLDSIIFALAPLGVIAVMVGAIRIGGPAWLKAAIGRARENRAVAELELMSSTSDEVGELWQDGAVVRLLGKPDTSQLIYLANLKYDPKTFGLYTLDTLLSDSVVTLKCGFNVSCLRSCGLTTTAPARHNSKLFTFLSLAKINIQKKFSDSQPSNTRMLPPRPISMIDDIESVETPSDNQQTNIQKLPPNILLNLQSQSTSRDLYLVACCGILLQSGVLLFSGFAVYYEGFNSRFRKNGSPVATYAYPMMAVGTITLIIGVTICAAIIELSTTEQEWNFKNGGKARLVWLQRSNVVSNQNFDPVAIFARKQFSKILVSRRSRIQDQTKTNQPDQTVPHQSVTNMYPPSVELLTILGTVTAFIGFVLQFQGFRALHWSASIAQLVATLLMTLLRMWVRRQVIVRPDVLPVPDHHILDWIGMEIAMLWEKPGIKRPSINDRNDRHKPLSWEIFIHDKNLASTGEWDVDRSECSTLHSQPQTMIAQHVVNIRRHLGQLTNWTGRASTLAISVADSIEAVMYALYDHCELTRFTWALKVKMGEINDKPETIEDIHFNVEKKDGK
jgi:hypothetical protein